MKEIYGEKVGMTQIFTAKGDVVPVTVIHTSPMMIIQKKTIEKDGYESYKVAFGKQKLNRINKTQRGEFKKVSQLKVEPVTEAHEVGDIITCDIFEVSEIVDVQGITKGHGTAGTIKRWNQHRHPMTHGVSLVHRASGSMGANSTPSRVFKGKRLAGHFGVEKVTVQNLEVVRVEKDSQYIMVKGAIPGPKGGVVVVKSASRPKVKGKETTKGGNK